MKSLTALRAHTTSASKNRTSRLVVLTVRVLANVYECRGAAEIPRHPRNLDSLVRRQDTSRKEAREKRKARKEEELLKKKEEVKRLKALKLKELRAKLERIGHEGGKKLEESKGALFVRASWIPHVLR